jgi:hypothetical protein
MNVYVYPHACGCAATLPPEGAIASFGAARQEAL